MALVNFNQSVNCGAQSKIENKIATFMSAIIPQEGNISISQTIQDRTAYFENEEQCKADYNEFRQKVEDIAKAIEIEQE